jgi:hypothetical protein
LLVQWGMDTPHKDSRVSPEFAAKAGINKATQRSGTPLCPTGKRHS